MDKIQDSVSDEKKKDRRRSVMEKISHVEGEAIVKS